MKASYREKLYYSDAVPLISPVSVQLDPEADIYVPVTSPVSRDTPVDTNTSNSCELFESPLTDSVDSEQSEDESLCSDTVKDVKADNRNQISGKKSIQVLAISGEFRCRRCGTSNIVAKHVDCIQMYRCHKCKIYVCEKCYIGIKGTKRTEIHDNHRHKVKEIEL